MPFPLRKYDRLNFQIVFVNLKKRMLITMREVGAYTVVDRGFGCVCLGWFFGFLFFREFAG